MNKIMEIILAIFFLVATPLTAQYQDYFYHWGELNEGLVLGLSVADDVLGFYIMNRTDDGITVYSHVSAGQKHFDNYYLHLQYLFGEEQVLVFIDDRDRSAPVFITMEPYQILGNYVYLKDWMSKPKFNIRKGLVIMWLEYDYQNDRPGYDVWKGTLYSGKLMTNLSE